ncbi:MAG: DUF4493 domain-containing protein [Rikenellaceae bacterium]
MNNTIKKIATFALLIALSISCKSEDVPYDTNGNSDVDTQSVGYLEFADMALSVDLDSEDITSKSSDSNRVEAGDDYLISIYSERESSVVYSSTYGELQSLSEPLSLLVGVYQISASSPDKIPLCSWEDPHYSGTKSITIIKNTTTEVSDLVCSLSNIKVSVTIAADLLAQFQADNGTDEDLNIKISLGDSSLNFGRTEERYGYFKAVEQYNDLVINLSGMYSNNPADEKPIYTMLENWTQTISGVEAGQWRKINIMIEHTSEGNVSFKVDVSTWLYDELINVDVMSKEYALQEVAIFDPDDETTDLNSPVVTLANGHDIADIFMVDESIFDFDALTCIDVIKANITPASGATVETLEVTFSSDNELFMETLEAAGFTDGTLELLPTNPCEEYLSIRTDEDNSMVVTAKYDAMVALYNFGGQHSAKIMAIDSEGRRSFTTLTIEVTPAVLPEGATITWRDGYDFETRYDISMTTTLPVVIDIESESGITDFTIYIDSDVLDESTLNQLDLATEMNLINPTTDEMEASLTEFNFPVGDEVEGATWLVFDISSFMVPLAALGAGESDFKLEVTDDKGVTIRTIKLNVLSE